MKIKIRKRVLSAVVGLILMATLICIMGKSSYIEVKAEENTATLPDTTQYITKEQLMENFDMDETTDKTAIKVYFGWGSQYYGDSETFRYDTQIYGNERDLYDSFHAWYVVGKDSAVEEDNIVLFSLYGTGVFSHGIYEKKYKASWGCTYADDIDITDVYSNHYGGSDLRAELQELTQSSNSDFSDTEIGLMNNTTITTYDAKNDTTYTTTDKLYALNTSGPYGTKHGDGVGTTRITAGSSDDLNVDSSVWIDRSTNAISDGWLRTPAENSIMALENDNKYGGVIQNIVNIDSSALLAFDLNLSSVLFASTLPPTAMYVPVREFSQAYAEFEVEPDSHGVFTLRYDAADKYGDRSVVMSADKTELTLAHCSGTCLVVQRGDGVAVLSIKSSKLNLEASKITINGTPLSDFNNCKVWVESASKDGRIVYATEAVQGYGLSVSNGTTSNGMTEELYAEGTTVTITADEAPEGETLCAWQVEGATVTSSDTQTITFTMPANDVTVEAIYGAPDYTIVSDPASIDFGGVNVDYASAPEAQEITITNAGNLEVALTQPKTVDSMRITNLSQTTLAAGETASLKVQPKTGLSEGTYNETIEVKTDKGTSTSVNVIFRVNGEGQVIANNDSETISGEDIEEDENIGKPTEEYSGEKTSEQSTVQEKEASNTDNSRLIILVVCVGLWLICVAAAIVILLKYKGVLKKR